MKTKVSFFEIVLTILIIPAIIYGLSISIDSSLYTNLSMAADDNGRVILKGFAYLLSFACLALPSLALYCFKTAIEQLQSNIAVTIKTLLVGVFCWWLWYNYAWPLQLIGYMGVQAQQNKLLEAGSTEAQNHRINEQAAISAYNSQIATLNASRDAALARISACKSYGSNKTTAKQNCINDANKGLQVIANSFASLKQPQLTSTANLATSSKHALFPAITTLKELDSIEAHILSDFSRTNAETSQVKYFSANAFSLESFNSILMFVLMVIWSKKGRLIDNVNTGIDSDVAGALEFREHNAPRPTLQQTANNLAESFKARYLNNQAPIANETRAEIQSPILPFDNPQPSEKHRGISEKISAESGKDSDYADTKSGFLADIPRKKDDSLDSADKLRDSEENVVGAGITLRDNAENNAEIRETKQTRKITLEKPEARVIIEKQVIVEKVHAAKDFKICALDGCTEQFKPSVATQKYCCTSHKDKARYLKKKTGES